MTAKDVRLISSGMLAGLIMAAAGITVVDQGKLALAKQPSKPQDAQVTTAAITSDNIVGTWFHTLTGRVANSGTTPISNAVVFYEIYQPTTEKLIDAGSTTVLPVVIPPGGEGQFQLSSNTTGRVKITLVRWQRPDRSFGTFSQMQFFPAP